MQLAHGPARSRQRRSQKVGGGGLGPITHADLLYAGGHQCPALQGPGQSGRHSSKRRQQEETRHCSIASVASLQRKGPEYTATAISCGHMPV